MISIVMGYFNRFELLDFTIQSISETKHSDYEVIVVNDFSADDQNPDLLTKKYPNTNIRVIHMSDVYETKTYMNPCIPYNVGFSKAQGDKIIIQNPECCHMGDVITYVEENLTNDEYMSFHCYASTQEDLPKIRNGQPITFLNPRIPSAGGCWYNHKKYRPKSLHFTTAITRDRLADLNGFDERFAQGNSYDDNEFIRRVENLLPVKYVESPYVIHQFHPKIVPANRQVVMNTNKQLLEHIQKNEPGAIRAFNNGKDIVGIKS